MSRLLDNPELLPVSAMYAATGVNTAIFRQSAVTSWGAYQFCAFYDEEARVTVARRRRDDNRWSFQRLPHVGRVQDAHNVISLGVSADGRVHVAYDHHNDPLRYRLAATPGELDFGDERPMTGQRESRISYPQFLNAPDGRFYFFFRDGQSGDGDSCLNRYIGNGEWEVLRHPLVAGEGRANAYWWRPSTGPDGAIHLAWCWRRTPDAATNFNVCYGVSRDHGESWTRSDGSPYRLPITADQAEVVDPVPEGSNLINQCSTCVDRQGRPHLVHYRNDEEGVPQIFHVHWDGGAWRANAVTQRRDAFSLGGGGTLRLPLSRPDIAVDSQGVAHVIYRDLEAGGRVRVGWADCPYAQWRHRDATTFTVGMWEPSYDPVAWRERESLELWVCPADQGDHETVGAMPPQLGYVLRLR